MSELSGKATPQIILVFSGKRKSGKDYVTDKLKGLIGEEVCEVMRLSAPLKKQYAIENNLDYNRLLDASEYKEMVRVDMIRWGEEKRGRDPGFFCRLATLNSPAVNKPVWIISDARRKTDIKYFKENYPESAVTVRVTASQQTRVKRGFVFTPDVDDVASECDLDCGVDFDIILSNDDDSQLNQELQQILSLVNNRLHKQ